ncbi:MAG: AEC family transporter [Betaproteobacteria bacterium]|nr:AEC family transporter [Betaproteobacteria bacterium]
MSAVLQPFGALAPYFVLVLIGYVLAVSGSWPRAVSDALAAFVFGVAIPAFLFGLMSDPARVLAGDARVVLAFFGACVITFLVARLVSGRLYRLDGVQQTVFGLGGIFSNNVLLGIPFAKALLGESALGPIALVLVFNTLALWTLATVSVEWARHGELSARGFLKTARKVVTTPVIAAILAGSAVRKLGLGVPFLIGEPLRMIGHAAAPLALIVVGMGLAEYGVRDGWRQGVGITAVKLVLQPLVVYVMARMFGLSPLETQAIVLLGSLAVGVNVYMMARQFDALQAPVASSMVFSTVVSALTTPLAVVLAAY